MAKIEIYDRTSRRTIEAELTSTCLETKPTGERLFQLVFNNVRITFKELEYEQFMILIRELYLESKEED